MQFFMQFITLCIALGDLVLLGIQWIYEIPGILFVGGKKTFVSLRGVMRRSKLSKKRLDPRLPFFVLGFERAQRGDDRMGLKKLWLAFRRMNLSSSGKEVQRPKTRGSSILLERLLHPFTRFRNDTKLRSIFTRLGYFLLGAVTVFLIFSALQMHTFVDTLPNPSLIGVVNYPVATEIVDRNGALLYEIYKDEKRTPVELKAIPDFVQNATIAIEDKGFYSHNGVSPIGGILRALRENVRTGETQGGSTITQQLVKTALLTPEKTLTRKIKEAILAIWVEQTYTKSQILGMYFNQVSYGGAAYGIEEAAHTYFGKSINDVTLSEGAFLAGLPKAPSVYSPYSDPQRARRRRDEVLSRMLELGYIDDDQYSTAVAAPLTVVEEKNYIRAPHFVFFIKQLLDEQFGARRVEQGGLRVVTSLDLRLQEHVEQTVASEVSALAPLHVSNGAAIVTVPSTGEVLAMVGSKNYFEEPTGAFNVTTGLRQPGSTIKPVLYSLGLQNHTITPASILDDSPITYSVAGAKPYSPVNYDGSYHGKVTVRTALSNSYNIPAVKLANMIGVGSIVEHGTRMGLSSWDDPKRYGLSIALGSAEVKMVDMAVAFGVFANGGDKVALDPLLRVTDYRGKVLYTAHPERVSVISKGVSFLINSILSDTRARMPAFGSAPSLQVPGHAVAVKTGTTNEKRDNFTIGYTSSVLAMAWVGNNDNTPMDPRLTSGITGAAPIWHDVMDYLLNTTSYGSYRYSPSFEPNDDVVRIKCGSLPGGEYVLKGTEDLVSQCSSRGRVISPTPR